MELEEEMLNNTAIVSKSMAVLACTAMTVLYVAILYAPTLILRLSPPSSYKHFLIRRFLRCCLLFSLSPHLLCPPSPYSELENIVYISNLWYSI